MNEKPFDHTALFNKTRDIVVHRVDLYNRRLIHKKEKEDGSGRKAKALKLMVRKFGFYLFILLIVSALRYTNSVDVGFVNNLATSFLIWVAFALLTFFGTMSRLYRWEGCRAADIYNDPKAAASYAFILNEKPISLNPLNDSDEVLQRVWEDGFDAVLPKWGDGPDTTIRQVWEDNFDRRGYFINVLAINTIARLKTLTILKQSTKEIV